jgi:hypothetical protein
MHVPEADSYVIELVAKSGFERTKEQYSLLQTGPLVLGRKDF